MATRADFTPDEWQSLATAPFITSLIVTVASPSGPLGVLKEAFAVSKSLVEASRDSTQSPLMRDLLADLKERKVKAEAPSVKAAEEVRKLSLDTARRVVDLLQRKAPDEATTIARWLYDTAEKVARASKEGGFLGFGGVEVDAKETAALGELAVALGLKSGTPGGVAPSATTTTTDTAAPTKSA
jgi:hypothetical protein